MFVAGGIGRGEAIAAYLEMGAVGVQLGTRFVCATECIAHPNFKKAFIRASARDAIASRPDRPAPAGHPGARAQEPGDGELFAAKQREVAQLLDEGAVEMAEAQLQIEHYWAGALRRAVIDGDVESGSVMAGQSVGMVTAKSRSPRSSRNWSTRPRPRSKAGANVRFRPIAVISSWATTLSMVRLALAVALLLTSSIAAGCAPEWMISFEAGSHRLGAGDLAVVSEFAKQYRARSSSKVVVLARGDSSRPANANIRLAQSRGEIVKAALVHRGVLPRDIVIRADSAAGALEMDFAAVPTKKVEPTCR